MIIEAPAKVNLTLEVTGVEANGYHTLDTLFAWLDLHDTLELAHAPETLLEVRADGVSTALVTSDESNLVLKALRALEAKVGRALPTRLSLTKRIPAGGGLGGGSADAAAALVGLRELHGLVLDDAELHALAARLGADVAFGLVGGLARGRRYGDDLQPLPLPGDLHARTVLLLAPGFPCPTPEVYRAWDAAPSEVARGSTGRWLDSGPEGRLGEVKNDLQAPAERLFPRLVELREAMSEAGLEGVCLSGSGSTLFRFVPREGSIETVEKKLQGLGKVIVTKLRERGRRG
jgi:4-diphosphocytidyl-2-C-methyl-D-erythritol kinase